MAKRSGRSAGGERAEGAGAAAPCGCGCAPEAARGGERKAVGVDAGAKGANLARLRRIEGQVRGIARMVEEDRYCADIMTQVAAVQEALRGVSRNLMRNHLKHCAAAAIKAGPEEAEAMYDELTALMFKNNR